MKRMLIAVLLGCFLLCGCSSQGQRILEPVPFYYVLDEFRYGEAESVFASEEREAAGHREDLNYLLALYLMGPSTDALRSPFPRGTRVLSVEQNGSHVKLKLNDTAQTMSDSDFTQTCVCLTLTCLDLTGAKSVTIQSGNRSVTMNKDTLILFDDTVTPEETQ